MDKIEFYKDLFKIEDKESIKKFLLYNSSLVIAGVKPSATVTVNKMLKDLYKSWIEYGKDFLEAINLSFINLREDENALIILIYNNDILKTHIFKTENIEFLRKLGYEHNNNNISYYVEYLKDRYDEFNCPHELGIFLGIPIDDVKSFMQCSYKKCLGCGYWKVYSNYEKAIEIFSIYDDVREKTMDKIVEGESIDSIVNNIIFSNYDNIKVCI
ncbi:DUF3793 family protein [Clostridium tertium]|uniref:DUF3793 family protein n=1 Tax=Clostridium tertium TaxID=1559 RepID=UPI001AE5DD6F|nr:DUF3793 family protein [Clostridium tertium]MBP1868423.1 hypothetical protein [Clostridium tertium]MDB1921766.1 DUF3793 family protein [Clostridium tertium]MDB1924969.1 DUF3793 family protein [Clostridium tertium]MDB1929368.1 DUF3793 family protein [Clostridium tertium]